MEGRRRHLAAGLKSLERALFPHFCQGCAAEGPMLCPDCRIDAVARLAGVFVCPSCGEPSAFGRQCGRPACGKKVALDGLISMASYRVPVLRKLLHAYKYEGVEEAGAELGSLFGLFLGSKRDMFAAVLAGAQTVAVPAHPLRRAARGFDQCQRFMAIAASCLGLKGPSRLLAKRFRLKTQASIDSEQARRLNAAGSIVCRAPAVQGKFVIFDDVATTGATLSECAKALKKSGATEVWAITLLRG